MEAPRQVSFKTEDRQWDGRFNVQADEDLTGLLDAIEQHWDSGRLKYILVGGVEVGTRPFQDDYQIKHVHVAAIFHDRISKASILKNWRVKQGNGYYLVPRNRDLPYAGWRNHHIKEFSKLDKDKTVLFERGELPQDLKRKRVDPSEEEKKLSLDECLKKMRTMYEQGDGDDVVFDRFPKYSLQYGEKIKSTLKQRRVEACHEGNPHIWLTGYPGTGKTILLNFVYPKLYKKNLYNRFFDLYDPKEHTHVMLEDLDHEAVEKLSINFIKTVCDEAGFAIDQKYKSPQLARTTVLVTSNFTIRELVPEGAGFDQNLAAISRRFWQIKIYELLRLLQLKLVPKEERAALKKEGNNDMSKLFMDWDYLSDVPTGKQLRSPDEYQQVIRDYFFALTS
uniref:Parvovirus non-structural protein 1 helicase domain-containing protein n=1 Tax=Trichosanthes kirilowii parvo-like virus TaxID=2739862 RepID=A0A6M9BP90_9VIRU|nr:hypothetical protein 2 [Trichosanthes kirilowii parvo-like virus]